jgi:hypothetical protein
MLIDTAKRAYPFASMSGIRIQLDSGKVTSMTNLVHIEGGNCALATWQNV